MKRNLTFFTAVICLLLASALVLTGCMYSIAEDNGEIKPYDLDRQNNNSFCLTDGNVIQDIPPAQTELQKKFNQYLHKVGNTVTIFSEEQYAELKAIRDNDNRTPLTYEEILFLVNDSINLYFTYDEIILPNANRDNVIPLLTIQSGNARVIKTEYKDANAYDTYNEAQIAYNEMLTNIYEIIYYRIYMHDAGFEMVHHTYHSGEDNIFGNRYNGNLGMISSAVPIGRYQMLAIDDATFSGIDNEEKLCGEYKTLLEWKKMREMDAIIDYEHYPYLSSAVLYTSILNTVRQSMEYKFYIAGPKNDPARQIYPTKELIAMKPQRVVVYRAIVEENSMQPEFGLDYVYGEATMSASIYFSYAMVGKFEEHDGVLEMHFGKSDYCYVFYKNEKGYYVYSAENSNPASGSFDFADGLMFEKYRKEIAPEPNAPNDDCSGNNDVSAPHDSDISNSKNENKTLYFKLDPAGNICSLMSSDGNPYADGTYVQEGDAYILSFDGGFRYVICYYENKGYEYDKDRSNPISGYELDRGTIFLFKDGILTAKTD